MIDFFDLTNFCRCDITVWKNSHESLCTRDYIICGKNFVKVTVLLKHVLGAISSIYTCAPLVSSLDMDYWCSAFGTKGARVNTGYGTPNMF